MAQRNWLAICTIGGGLLGGAIGVAGQDIFGGVFGGLMIGGVVGLSVRSKTRPKQPATPGLAQAGFHDPYPHAHLGIGAIGMASAPHAQGQGADASCSVDSGGFSGDFSSGGDCGGGDAGGGGS